MTNVDRSNPKSDLSVIDSEIVFFFIGVPILGLIVGAVIGPVSLEDYTAFDKKSTIFSRAHFPYLLHFFLSPFWPR